jgi:hypothetical protein
VFVLLAAAAAQRVIHVPADQPTIQAGINAAEDKDTVLVAPGTYNEAIAFKGKAITVRSSDGPDATTIDGTGIVFNIVNFTSGETRTSVLRGFTIANGYGILIGFSSPAITGNTIVNNHSCFGGGIYISGPGSPLVMANRIIGNSGNSQVCGASSAGGIAVSDGASAHIIGNDIENNSAGSGYS